jgi:ribosomal protein S1
MGEQFDPLPVDLNRFFPDYRLPVADAAWLSSKQRFAVRSVVCGTIVVRYPFGVFVDIGVGFPALLLIDRFRDAKPRTTPADFPPVGSLTEAKIWGWNDRDRAIVLTQLDDV